MKALSSYKVGLCQFVVREGKQQNLDRARESIETAVRRGAKLVVLPEMFNCPYDTAFFADYAEGVPAGPSCRMLSEAAGDFKVHIVGGSLPERQGQRVYNTSVVFNPQGRLIARHRKIHLFDVSLKTVRMRESDVLSPGSLVTVFPTPFGSMGLLVCYDARFPELFRLMLKKGIAAVVMPAAFSRETGSSHWHALVRARAMDNQIYMLACSPARGPSAGYQAYGHSLVADPWGRILAEAGEREGVVIAELEKARLTDVRSRLPLLAHRRTDLYDVIAKRKE